MSGKARLHLLWLASDTGAAYDPTPIVSAEHSEIMAIGEFDPISFVPTDDVKHIRDVARSKMQLTNRRISLASSFTLTRFLNILPMRFSRKITISWLKYCMRAGLLVNVAFGNLSRMYWVKVSGIAGRGKVVDDHGSFGPGTNMNWQ